MDALAKLGATNTSPLTVFDNCPSAVRPLLWVLGSLDFSFLCLCFVTQKKIINEKNGPSKILGTACNDKL